MLIKSSVFLTIHRKLLFSGLESTENLRSSNGLDLEISDRFIFKIGSVPKIKFYPSNRTFCSENFEYLKNKSDLIGLIKVSNEGVFLGSIISTYGEIKADLIDIVKFKGKERKVILLKGKNFNDISLFPFEENHWIPISQETINFWHS